MSTPPAGEVWLTWGWGSGLCPARPLSWAVPGPAWIPFPEWLWAFAPALKAPLALQEVGWGPQEGHQSVAIV